MTLPLQHSDQTQPHQAADPTPREDDARVEITRNAAWRLTGITLTLAGMIAATYFVPALRPLQPWKSAEGYVPFWNIVGREWLGEGEALAREQERIEQLRLAALRAQRAAQVAAARPASEASSEEESVAPEPLAVFPEYHAAPEETEEIDVRIENVERLDPYFRRLALADLKVSGVLARAAHWGDSLLGDDGLTAGIRRRLQLRFGDGGHGFHVLAPSNAFHLRRGLRFKVPSPWTSRCEVLFRCEPDNRYGLGGVSTRSSGGGHSWFSTMDEAPGDRVSRFELWYQTGPYGSIFEIQVDGEVVREIPTLSDTPTDEVAVVPLTDAPHTIEVRAVGRGSVRGYGVVLEREGPGAVWDNLGVIGLSTAGLRAQDDEHIQGQVQKRNLDLLVFGLGGNDAQRPVADLRIAYEKEYTQVIGKYRAGKPDAACLVLSVTDHGERTGENAVRTRRSVPELVALQRRVAEAQGCAFFDLFEAMGGDGSVRRWFLAKPALIAADLGHPTSAGHEVLANLIYRALMHGYADYRRRVTGQPVPELEESPALPELEEPPERVDAPAEPDSPPVQDPSGP